MWGKFPKRRPAKDGMYMCCLIIPITDEELAKKYSYCAALRYLRFRKQAVSTLSDGTIVKGGWFDINETEDLTANVKYWKEIHIPIQVWTSNKWHKYFGKKRSQ